MVISAAQVAFVSHYDKWCFSLVVFTLVVSYVVSRSWLNSKISVFSIMFA